MVNKENPKLGRNIFIGAIIATILIVGAVILIATSKNQDSPSGDPTSSAQPVKPNAVDATAVVGTATLLQQIPDGKDPKLVAKFQENLKQSVNSKTPKVDVGFKGNTLVSYTVGKQGSGEPACVTIKPEGEATQATWAGLSAPTNNIQGSSPLIIIKQGISDCKAAFAEFDTIKNDPQKRAEVNNASITLVAEAYNSIPFVGLTPGGLALWDNIRILSGQASQ